MQHAAAEKYEVAGRHLPDLLAANARKERAEAGVQDRHLAASMVENALPGSV